MNQHEIARVVQTSVAESRDENGWSSLDLPDRLQVIQRVRASMELAVDELADVEARESGKFPEEAVRDVLGCIELWRFAESLIEKELHAGSIDFQMGLERSGRVEKRPIGPVLIVTPYNYPLIVLSERLPFALAAGCPVIVKPSELTPSSARLLAELARNQGLPNGAMQVISGGAEVGAELVRSDAFRMISFTGSSEVGGEVARNIDHRKTRLSLELGGKNSFIVCSDADLHRAAESAAYASTINGGQACIAASRFVIDESIFVDFLQCFAEQLRMTVRNNISRHSVPVQQPPSQRHFERVLEYQSALQQVGWEEYQLDGIGFDDAVWSKYIYPRLFVTSDVSSELFSSEFFAPFLTATSFRTVEDACAIANAGEFGLAAYVWSSAEEQAAEVSSQVRAGRQWLNSDMRTFNPRLPIGGFGKSGISRELGDNAIDHYRIPVGVVACR